jgi:hypothetical protein
LKKYKAFDKARSGDRLWLHLDSKLTFKRLKKLTKTVHKKSFKNPAVEHEKSIRSKK